MQPEDTNNPPSQPQSRLATTSSLIFDLKEMSPERWDSFVTVYKPLLKFWIRKKVASQEAQDDILQDCYQSIIIGIANFERGAKGGTFRGWLRTIVKFKVADHYRKQSPERLASQEVLDATPTPEQKTANEIEAEEQALKDLKFRAIEHIRQSTNDKTWQMYWMFGVEKIPAAEVASKFGVSDAAVRVAKARVLKRLRDVMIDEFEE